MILKIDLNGKQFAALQQFLRSDENKVEPPPGFQFSVMAPINGKATDCRVLQMPLASFLTEPCIRGPRVTVTLQILEYALIVKEGPPRQLLDLPVFFIPVTVLLKLFETISRFPATAKVFDQRDPATLDKVLFQRYPQQPVFLPQGRTPSLY